MANILPSEETTEFESRQYVNPQLTVDQTSDFITNLRNTQQAETARIAEQTQDLGTDIQSNLGGLGGGSSYWTSRYQTPNMASTVADLRATAQASALNDVLANEKAIWQKRYQDAYRNYQKSQYNKSEADRAAAAAARAAASNSSTSGGVEYEDTTANTYSGQGTLNVTYGDETQTPNTNRVSIVEPGSGYTYTWEYPVGSMDTNSRKLVNTDDPSYYRSSDGYMYRSTSSSSSNKNNKLDPLTPLGHQAGLGW